MRAVSFMEKGAENKKRSVGRYFVTSTWDIWLIFSFKKSMSLPLVDVSVAYGAINLPNVTAYSSAE
jgi:hypothetical protein